jgi:hypothetical protein
MGAIPAAPPKFNKITMMRIMLTPTPPWKASIALRYDGRRRIHTTDELMIAIAAKRPVEHLQRSGFVVMRKSPIGGSSCLQAANEGAPG